MPGVAVESALELVGEWWTMLILREAFLGTRRFHDFQRNLGIARNILSARLKKLEEPRNNLQRTVTDQFFHLAKNDKDPATQLRARAMAWSLTYFLAKNKLPNLLRYFQELSKLPRDLQFDDAVLLLTFARAFDLVDPRNPDRVDQSKLDALASDWHNYVRKTPLEVAEAIKQVHKLEIKTPPAQGGQNPYGPGGAGGGGGPKAGGTN